MAKWNVISSDSHIEAPPNGWIERLPADLRDQAPVVVTLPDGGDGVSVAGGPPAPLGLQITGGQKYRDFRTKGHSFSDGLPGTGGPQQRLLEQDQDGVDAELLFCAVVATSLRKIKDPRMLNAIATAWNSWLSDYCSHNPDRLFGVGLAPPTTAQDAIAEMERIAKLPGLVCTQLLTFPNGGDWGTYGDEPFWAAANAMNMPIVAHHNFGGESSTKSHPLPGQEGNRPLQLDGSVDLSMFAWLLTCDLPIPTLPILTIEQLFLGGVLDRYPNLRLFFGESGIGWLPYWMEQIDDRFERHRHWAGLKLRMKPTDYIRKHFMFSFMEDHAGVALRHSIGVDNICWCNDFPHSVGDWPFSRETRERQMGHVPDAERRRMEGLNIAEFLHLITKEEKEQMALEPRSEKIAALHLPARGARRA